MNELSLWISPLLILPGVALLIMSTSARFTRLHDEIDHIVYGSHGADDWVIGELLKRGRLFRDALISLYVAVALLAAAGLAGVVLIVLDPMLGWIPAGMTAVAVGAVVYGALLLIRESGLSLGVIESHVRERKPEPGS